MKKVLSLVLVLTLVLGSFSFAFAAPSDVVGTEYEEAVERLGQLGILTGYTDGTFKPNNTITRAEFAAVVVRAKGLEAAALAAKGATTFSDVPAENWASGYVNIASKMGFVKGMGDGTFAPAAPVTYEQAVTMVMRALGYEPAALERGGYPYGYLIVANENDLLEAVKGTQGLPAPRGLVAQLVDNALEIPLMIQVYYGGQPTWVKSGSTKDTEAKYLLDELGFEKVAKDRVVSINPDKNEIKFEKYGKAKVAEGFDFEKAYGIKINAWLNGDDKVVIYTVAEDAKYDAVKVDGEKLKLVKENKKYEVANKATLLLDGEEVDAEDFTADYAKIVLNSDDEIIWARGFTWYDTLIVQSVKDTNVKGFGEEFEELDVEDYVIVKDGKTISVEDLEKGDVLFFSQDEEYAVVYNDSKTGEIERVYEDSFKFDGKVYSYNPGLKYVLKYLDEETLEAADAEVMDSMKDEGKVEVFFDHGGRSVLVAGKTGEEKTNYFYGVVESNTIAYETRGKVSFTLDVLNNEEKVVKYDVSSSFADKYDNGKEDFKGTLDKDLAEIDPAFKAWRDDIKEKAIVKVTVNESGSIKAVKALSVDGGIGSGDRALRVEDKEVDGYELRSNTLVVLVRNSADPVKDYEVFTWEKAKDEFSKVTEADVYAGSNGRVEVLVVKDSDAAEVTEALTGLVTKVRQIGTKDQWELTVEIKGEKKVYLTSDKITAKPAVLDEIVQIEINKLGQISNVELAKDLGLKISGLTVEKVGYTNKTLTVTGSVYSTFDLRKDAVVYDKDLSKIDIKDIKAGDTVDVYRVNTTTDSYVNYVVRTAEKGETPKGEGKITGTLEEIYTSTIQVNGKLYEYAGDTSSLSAYKTKTITFDTQEVNGRTYAFNIREVK